MDKPSTSDAFNPELMDDEINHLMENYEGFPTIPDETEPAMASNEIATPAILDETEEESSMLDSLLEYLDDYKADYPLDDFDQFGKLDLLLDYETDLLRNSTNGNGNPVDNARTNLPPISEIFSAENPRNPNLAYNVNNNTINTVAIFSATGRTYQQPNQISASDSSLSIDMPPQAKRPRLSNHSTSSSSSNLHNTSKRIVTTNPTVNLADAAFMFQGNLKCTAEMNVDIQVYVINPNNLNLSFLSMISWGNQCQLNFFPLLDCLKRFFAGISLTNPNSLDGSDNHSGATSHLPVSAELVLAMNSEALSVIINMLNSTSRVNFAFVQPTKYITPDIHVQVFCMLSTGQGLKVFIPKDPKGLFSEMRRRAPSVLRNMDQSRNSMTANYYGNFGQPYTMTSGPAYQRYSAPGIQSGQVGVMSSAPSVMVAPAQQDHFCRAGIPQPPSGSFIQTPRGIMPAQQQQQYIATGSGNANMAPPQQAYFYPAGISQPPSGSFIQTPRGFITAQQQQQYITASYANASMGPAQQAHFYRAGIPQPPSGSFIQTSRGIIPAQQQQQYIATGSSNTNVASAQQAYFYPAGIHQPPPGSFIQTPRGFITAQHQHQYIAGSYANASMGPAQQAYFYRAGIPQPPPGSFIQTPRGFIPAQQQYIAASNGNVNMAPGIGGIVVPQQQQMANMDPQDHPNPRRDPRLDAQ